MRTPPKAAHQGKNFVRGQQDILDTMWYGPGMSCDMVDTTPARLYQTRSAPYQNLIKPYHAISYQRRLMKTARHLWYEWIWFGYVLWYSRCRPGPTISTPYQNRIKTTQHHNNTSYEGGKKSLIRCDMVAVCVVMYSAPPRPDLIKPGQRHIKTASYHIKNFLWGQHEILDTMQHGFGMGYSRRRVAPPILKLDQKHIFISKASYEGKAKSLVRCSVVPVWAVI